MIKLMQNDILTDFKFIYIAYITCYCVRFKQAHFCKTTLAQALNNILELCTCTVWDNQSYHPPTIKLKSLLYFKVTASPRLLIFQSVDQSVTLKLQPFHNYGIIQSRDQYVILKLHI